MRPGDLVNPQFRSTTTGLPVPMGMCELLEKIGTVPNFWRVKRLDPSAFGKVVSCFVYPEDLVAVKNRPSLQVIDFTERERGDKF